MSDLPPPEHLRQPPMVYYVRAALVEIGFQYRCAKQWDAWVRQREKEQS